MKNNLQSEILEILELTEGDIYDCDKKTQERITQLLALIKKHERTILEEIHKYGKDLTSVTNNKKHNTAVLRLLNYLAKLKDPNGSKKVEK